MKAKAELKYKLKEYFERLPPDVYKVLRKELPIYTGYQWKTIKNQWATITKDQKRSIPSEALDKIAMYLSVKVEDLKNYTVEPPIFTKQTNGEIILISDSHKDDEKDQSN